MDMRKACRADFARLAEKLQDDMWSVLQDQIAYIERDLNGLRESLAEMDSERDPGFRDKVQRAMVDTEEKIAEAQQLIREAEEEMKARADRKSVV